MPREPQHERADTGRAGDTAGTAGTRDRERHSGAAGRPDLRDLEALADLLDSRFRIPGTRIRFGLDSLLGLVPGVGDAATALPAAWILYRAHRMGVPKTMLARMGCNVAIDLGLGAIPVIGDLVDLGFKANRRNVALLRQHFGQPPDTAFRGPAQGPF